MKKILFMLIFLITINVQAKEQYSDYEFIDYVEEAQENDELNKYEPVLLNNFYKLEESDSDYLETDWDAEYEFIDKDDYKTEKFFSQLNLSYNRVGKVTAAPKYNYLFNTIKITNIQNYQSVDIREIEVYQDDRLINTEIDAFPELKDGDKSTKVNLTNNSISIRLLPYNFYVTSIRIVIYYGNNIPLEFGLSMPPQSGMYEFKNHFIPDNKARSTVIDFKQTDNFNTLLSSNNLKPESTNDIVYYTEYEKRLFKHYNLEKKYYIMSELSSLEGFEYDQDESVKMYKHYKREKIDIPDNNEIIEKPTIPSQIIESDDKPNNFEKNISVKETNNTQINDTVSLENTKDSNKSTSKKRNNYQKNRDEEEQSEQLYTNSNNKEDNVTNTANKNSQSLSNFKSSEETCECSNKPNFWFILSLLFIIISVICDYLHYKHVKVSKE